MKKRIFIITLILIPFMTKGQEAEWLSNKDSIFTSTSSQHFNLYTFKGHLGTQTRLDLLKKREIAYHEISDFFEIETDVSVNIFLFENEEIKYNLTGHKGFGWGFDNNITEVFNGSVQMDPYHELSHVIGYTLNQPPALIDEGTAVYLSQQLGDKAFSRLIGYPTKSTNEILLMLSKKDGLKSISTLFSYDEFGNSNNATLDYCQAASFVEFLTREFGKQKFLELFKSLSFTKSTETEMIFERIYHLEMNQIENKWRKQIRANN
ncbi:hypothetical protein [Draconibacterium sediminis]|uniref:peptidase MA family metallohydrolase n=1 Tax=Draconibacterium sediminis TaxID=1544798 RepID=UPI0026F241BB|nr:hypothetical protein [Draconibacterium sediminis]